LRASTWFVESELGQWSDYVVVDTLPFLSASLPLLHLAEKEQEETKKYRERGFNDENSKRLGY
jgi:hypothetical protein